MDGVTLIMEALETGNAPDVGVHAMDPDTFRFQFDEFVNLVAAKLLAAGQPELLEQYMGMPDLYESALADALEESGAATDSELIFAAQSFMETMDPRRATRGEFTVDVDEDVEGFI